MIKISTKLGGQGGPDAEVEFCINDPETLPDGLAQCKVESIAFLKTHIIFANSQVEAVENAAKFICAFVAQRQGSN